MNGHSAHTPARITFRVLGPLEVEGPGGRPIDIGGGKPATMLTLLLLHRNAWVSTDQLIDAVWAGRDVPPSAQRNLKTYAWQLRRALPDERIESRPGAYRVSVLPGELDADLAAALSDQVHGLLATDAGAAEAAVLVEQALGLWRGCPYDGLTADATTAVDRLTELHRSLREDLADAQLALGRSADAISLLRALTDEEPLRELAWTKLMAALRRTGRRHDALAAYQRARTALVRELGIEPGAELTLLHQEILSEEGAVAPRPATTGGRSDLPGRIAGFVGRSAELAAIASARISDGVGVVTIDGMPGVGKTAVALEAANELDCPDGQFYLDLRTHSEQPLDAFGALGKLIRSVGGPESPLPAAMDERASLWRSLGARILLVLDDAADASQVRQLLPNTPGSIVLVTSRHRLTGLNRTGSVSLDVLPMADATRLAESARLVGDIEAEHVLRWCAGHPAALRHIADRMRDRKPWTVTRLAARLDDSAGRCQELAEIHALFDPTYAALTAPVRKCYRFLSLTPTFDVRRAARLLDTTQQDVEAMLDELLDRHLVSESAAGRYVLHPLVRDHAHTILLATESADELTAATNRVRQVGRGELELVSPEELQGPRVVA